MISGVVAPRYRLRFSTSPAVHGPELFRVGKSFSAMRRTLDRMPERKQLETLIREEKSYEAARRRALARLAKGYDLGWSRPADRGELHER